MKPGNCYMIHCGDWHTYVGRVVKQATPLLWEFASVSKISNTNNEDCWQDLAEGNAQRRKEASYKHYRVKMFLPISIAAFEWIGNTPQEDGIE